MADAQCERDALGAALTYNQLLDSLSPELFRDPSCSAIFTAARAVFSTYSRCSASTSSTVAPDSSRLLGMM